MAKHRKRRYQAALNRHFNRPFGYVRQKLANNEAVLSLSLAGIIAGALAAGVILLFRALIDASQNALLPGGIENFEGLDEFWRFALPAGGGGDDRRKVARLRLQKGFCCLPKRTTSSSPTRPVSACPR